MMTLSPHIQTDNKRGVESCRAIALDVLLSVEQGQIFADEGFDRVVRQSTLSKVDRALAFELVQGVLRNRGILDWYLNALTHRPLLHLPPAMVMILRLGAYQILYLDRIPESAAVNEAVHLAKRVKGRDWRGVVNAVLRNLIRQPLPSLPDPKDDPILALSVRYSCPLWLVERWVNRLGLAKAEQVCQETLETPPLTVRANILRCTRDQLMDRLRKEGVLSSKTNVSPQGLILEKCGSLSSLRVLQEGLCYVEDEAAQLVPFFLDVQPGHRVLDACAAPGGKCTHLAELMDQSGEIIATDRSETRLRLLRKNATRLGITNIHCLRVAWGEERRLSPEVASVMEAGFDRILLDVPCSGLGILRRHPEGKWQKARQLLENFQEIQGKIISQVSTYLRRGGVLVYSSCSAEPEETTHVISQFCRDHPEFQHEPVVSFLPPEGQSLINSEGDFLTLGSGYGMDGFFAARLRKV